MKIKNIVGSLPVLDTKYTLNIPLPSEIKWKEVFGIVVAGNADEYFWNLFSSIIPNYTLFYNARISYKNKRDPNALVYKIDKDRLAVLSEKPFLDVAVGEEVNLKVHSLKEFEIKSDIINPLPYSFMDFVGNHIALENMYKNGHIFVVSSGPSFKDFKDKDKLRFVATACVNNSPKALFPIIPTIWSSVDSPSKFLHYIWANPHTLKIICEGHKDKHLWNNDLKKDAIFNTKDCPNIAFVKRNSVFNPETFLSETSCSWGNNENIAAKNGVKGKRSVLIFLIKILYLLGFRNVYLLGCDFNMTPDNKYSFDQDRHAGSISGNNQSYKQMNYFFDQVQPSFLKADFNVFNLNKESGLKSFPFMSFDEAFKRALKHVHNVEEYIKGNLMNTSCLYETQWYVCPACKHEAMYVKIGKDKTIPCERCKAQISQSNRKKGG